MCSCQRHVLKWAVWYVSMDPVYVQPDALVSTTLQSKLGHCLVPIQLLQAPEKPAPELWKQLRSAICTWPCERYCQGWLGGFCWRGRVTASALRTSGPLARNPAEVRAQSAFGHKQTSACFV